MLDKTQNSIDLCKQEPTEEKSSGFIRCCHYAIMLKVDNVIRSHFQM
jgi:hypothetical protein